MEIKALDSADSEHSDHFLFSTLPRLSSRFWTWKPSTCKSEFSTTLTANMRTTWNSVLRFLPLETMYM